MKSIKNLKLMQRITAQNTFKRMASDVKDSLPVSFVSYNLGEPVYEFEKGDKFIILGIREDRIAIGYIQYNQVYKIIMQIEEFKGVFNYE